MRTSTIYGLCDPETGALRYIGKTVVPLHIRLSQHVSRANKGTRTHLHCWLRSLTSRPSIVALETVPFEEDAAAEVRLIAEYRGLGCDLTNATDGGEGKKGCFHTEESKAKIRASNLGRKMPPKSSETLQRMSDAQRGKTLSAVHRAKIARGGMGRKPTPETREKLRTASKDRRFSAEAIAKSVALRKGKPLSPEHRAKVRAVLTRPDVVAKMRLANTGRVKTPEEIAHHAAQLRGRKHPPEVIERMRQAAFARWARQKATG